MTEVQGNNCIYYYQIDSFGELQKFRAAAVDKLQQLYRNLKASEIFLWLHSRKV